MTEAMDKGKDMQIPYVKPVRIGNFKMWRSRYRIDKGDKTGLDCINVSTMDGAWMVRVPSTSAMYATFTSAWNTADEDIRQQFLGMLTTNMYNISSINSEALHDAFFFLQEEIGGDKDKFEKHIEKMCEYRRKLYELIEQKKARFIAEYERQIAERRAKEEDADKQLRQDEIAEQAMEMLGNDFQ